MDRLKLYSGSIDEDSLTKSAKTYYGVTSNTTVKKSKTELLNNKLQEFLIECGVDTEYDGDFLWINNVPLTFAFTPSSNYYYQVYFPFNSTLQYGNSSYTHIFSGLDYNFKVRLLGEPSTAFVLLISTISNNSPLFNSSAFCVAFFKAENIINKKESRIYGKVSSALNLASFDLDANIPVNIGRSTPSAPIVSLKTIAADFVINENKFPIVECVTDIFKISGCYYNLANDPLPQGVLPHLDAQTFIKIGGDVYYRGSYIPLIKCTT